MGAFFFVAIFGGVALFAFRKLTDRNGVVYRMTPDRIEIHGFGAIVPYSIEFSNISDVEINQETTARWTGIRSMGLTLRACNAGGGPVTFVTVRRGWTKTYVINPTDEAIRQRLKKMADATFLRKYGRLPP